MSFFLRPKEVFTFICFFAGQRVALPFSPIETILIIDQFQLGISLTSC